MTVHVYPGYAKDPGSVRILFINSIQMFGGGEVWLFRTMKELGRRGHRVSLLCRPGAVLEHRARKMNFTVHTVKMGGDLDPLVIWKTYRILKKAAPDVVVTNMDKELRFGGIAAKLAGVPAVIPRRGIDHPLKDTWMYRLSYEKIADGIIANSRSTKHSLLRNCAWLEPEKIEVIYNGIDPEPFTSPAEHDIRREAGLQEEDFVIGFVGQFDQRKGVDILAEAFLAVSGRNERARLMLTGEGPLRNRLEELTKDAADRVIFTGYREDIENVMKAVDVLVLPSFWEGFGIVLIEAMAAGKPVITTNASNMPEIVSHGKDGFLAEPGSVPDLVEYISLLAEDGGMREKMGRAGQQKVLKQFTLETMVDYLERYFYSRCEQA